MLRVERAAHAIFAAHGLDLRALRLPQEFEEHLQWTMACVAEVQDRVVGMARLSRLAPGLLSLDQVSVDPDYAGHGIGRRLLMKVVATARQRGYEALIGTTFRDVAFTARFMPRLDVWRTPTRTRRCGASARSSESVASTSSENASLCGLRCRRSLARRRGNQCSRIFFAVNEGESSIGFAPALKAHTDRAGVSPAAAATNLTYPQS